MAKCKECGGELFETSKFCPECGAPVTDEPAKNEAPADVKTEAVTDEAARNILDDIPDIKKIDITSENTESKKAEAVPVPEPQPAAEVHTEEKSEPEPKQEEKPASEPEVKPAPKAEPEKAEKNVSTEPEKKKSKAGIVVIVVILIIAAIGAGVYFFMQNGGNNDGPVLEETAIYTEETVTEEAVPVLGDSGIEAVTEATEVITETAVSEESVTAVPTETTAVSEESVTADSSETAVVSEESVTSEAAGSSAVSVPAEDIVLEPEHVSVMGPNISMEFLLSEQGVTADMFTEASILIAEYTTTIPKIGGTPMTMVMRIADTEIVVNPSSTTDNSAVFEYSVMVNAAEAAGFTAADIDAVAFKGTGAPIDVVKVTITNA